MCSTSRFAIGRCAKGLAAADAAPKDGKSRRSMTSSERNRTPQQGHVVVEQSVDCGSWDCVASTFRISWPTDGRRAWRRRSLLRSTSCPPTTGSPRSRSRSATPHAPLYSYRRSGENETRNTKLAGRRHTGTHRDRPVPRSQPPPSCSLVEGRGAIAAPGSSSLLSATVARGSCANCDGHQQNTRVEAERTSTAW